MLSAQDYFASRGYHEFGAGAIIGNGCGKSGPNLDSTFDRVHADHGSGGAWEWRDSEGSPRKTRLAAFADARAPGLRNDLFIQCEYVMWELHEKFPELDDQLRNPGSRTIANLTANFCWIFEDPRRRLASTIGSPMPKPLSPERRKLKRPSRRSKPRPFRKPRRHQCQHRPRGPERLVSCLPSRQHRPGGQPL
jgi:Phage tail lysozyme